MTTKTKKAPVDPAERLASVKSQLTDLKTRGAVATENAATARATEAGIRASDYSSPTEYAKALAAATAARTAAEAEERFFDDHIRRAEEEMRQAVLDDARGGILSTIAAAKLAEPVLRDAVAAFVRVPQFLAITDAASLMREADAGQVECCNELTAAGEPTQPQRTELALALPSLIDRSPGAIGTLRTAANIAQFIADEPARAEQRRQEQAERAEAERRRFQAEALQGRHGAAAQRQAEVEHRAWAASFYGGGVAALCGADPEVAGYQAYRSLNEAAEEA